MQMLARKRLAEDTQGGERLQKVNSGKLLLHTAARQQTAEVYSTRPKGDAPEQQQPKDPTLHSRSCVCVQSFDVAVIILVSSGLEYQRLHNKTP